MQPIPVYRNGCTEAKKTLFVIGDVNEDGAVDKVDQDIIGEAVGGRISFDGRFDIDGDDTVSISDWSALGNVIAGKLVVQDGLFYIALDLTASDERYMLLFENVGTESITVSVLPGTLGAKEKEITLRAGAVSAFTFDSRFFKHTEGEHKGKILFSSTGHDLAMRVFEIK